MARRPFGGTTADVTLDASGDVVPGTSVTAWTARTGGTQVTDLQDLTGVTLSGGTIVASSAGIIAFLGPADGTAALWIDAGLGIRYLMNATDLPARVTSLESAPSGGGTAATTTFTPAGSVGATDVQAAIVEVATEYAAADAAEASTRSTAVTGLQTSITANTTAIALRGIFVDHGSTASTARPASTLPVKWFGTVAPTNAVTNDEWYDRSTDLLKRYNGTAWVSGSGTSLPVPTTGDAGKVLTVNGTEDGYELDTAAGGAAPPSFSVSGLSMPYPATLTGVGGGYFFSIQYLVITADQVGVGAQYVPSGRSGSCTTFTLKFEKIDLATFAAVDTGNQLAITAEYDFAADQLTMPEGMTEGPVGTDPPILASDSINGILFQSPGLYRMTWFMGGVVLDPT